jgi:enamine deaminase RidA (YjgF/YER057c/UK114 family)
MARVEQAFHMMHEAEAGIGFSQAIRGKHFLHLSGIASLDADFRVVAPGDMRKQIEHIYTTIGVVLRHHGLGFKDVVKETIYTIDIPALIEAAPVRKPFFDGCACPAATWVGVAALVLPELRLEVEVLAELN